MDPNFFDRLDQLERGARETRPRRQENRQENFMYRGYGGNDYEANYHGGGEEVYGDENAYPQDMNDSMHMGAASYYDERSQQPMRRSLMPPPQLQPHSQPYRSQAPPARELTNTRPFNMSQYAYGGATGGATSSSPYEQTLPSSPVVSASRRRSAVSEHVGRMQPMQPMPQYRPAPYTPKALDHQQDNDDEYGEEPEPEMFERAHRPPATEPPHNAPANGPPVVQGITLVPTQKLPDRFRSMFSFPLFNAVQSKCFPVVYNTNDNFVLSAPTGSGKTAVLELAICRLMNGFANGSYKVIYQAPTKSLCSERQRDWQNKFGRFDLQVAELTGDTDNAQLRNVQHASIIITTPEKWDSMTRKWKDHQKLMQMVKLFLIDEVHILKEDRGATLEAIVSRMKSIGSDIRFVALSATVPNSQDIATWLGKDSVTPHLPAPRERFGEEFRPVPLSKHVCGYQSSGNDFAFEKTLNAKLPEIIARWSQRKPIMVFCFTRSSCVETAKLLANWWATKGPKDRYWEAPRKRVNVEDKELRDPVASGVAYHHAGLSINDRNTIEKAYLEGNVNVICCTSTLAVGVNLPCHMVIIKNTVGYQSNGGAGGCKEYSDLEVMQMLGRAGRPQFDKSAVAVILTRLQKQSHYEKMVTGQEVLESCLHANLIDHVNAEIGLGTITSASTAKRWLSGTFLYVRLKENPEHYKIDGDLSGRNLEERLELICKKAITRLEGSDLIRSTPKLQCTEFGDAMARYCLQFETMQILLALPPQSKTSEILSSIAQASEFKEVRFRAGEKPTYKALNQNSSIKFPIPVNLDAPAHKISLIIQAVLGAIDFPSEDHKQRNDFMTAKSVIFVNIQRLIRCVVDCQLYLQDSVAARNALALARSLGAAVWDDSPLHMKQLDGVGLVSVRKLASAGLKTVDDIENTEQHRLEGVLSRNPPFGMQLQEKAKDFPKLRVAMKSVGEPLVRKGEHVVVRVRCDLGFMNEKTPELFQRKPVYVCLLAELSDGHLLHFARIRYVLSLQHPPNATLTFSSAKKLNRGQEVMFEAKMTSANQTIRAYVMCDAIAGTMRNAILSPDVSPSVFPAPKTLQGQASTGSNEKAASKATTVTKRKVSNNGFDEFGDASIDDTDMALAANGGFENIDDFSDDDARTNVGKGSKKKKQSNSNDNAVAEFEPQQLENGKWACNHACKDKTVCKHLCCREGLDKKPKPPKPKAGKKEQATQAGPKQTQLSMTVNKKAQAQASTQSPQPRKPGSVPAPKRSAPSGPEIHKLNTLHNNVQSNKRAVPLLSSKDSEPSSSVLLPKPGQSRISFSEAARRAENDFFSDDFGDDADDFSMLDEAMLKKTSTHMSPLMQPESDLFEPDGHDMLDDLGAVTAIEHQQFNAPLYKSTRGSSLYDIDDDLVEPFEQNLAVQSVQSTAEGPYPSGVMLQTGKNQIRPGQDRVPQTLKPTGPILEVSSNSAAFDLGCKAQDSGHPHKLGGETDDRSTFNVMSASSEPAVVGKSIRTADEPSQLSDTTTKTMMEELGFGAGLFNYTG